MTFWPTCCGSRGRPGGPGVPGIGPSAGGELTAQGGVESGISGPFLALFSGPPGGGPESVSKRPRNGPARKWASGCTDIYPMGVTPPLMGGVFLVAGPRQMIIDPPPIGGGICVAGPRQVINSRFLQVLQIQKWGVRSAKRAGNGAVGGPSQLEVGINKGPRLEPISGPAPGGRTPRPTGGVSP